MFLKQKDTEIDRLKEQQIEAQCISQRKIEIIQRKREIEQERYRERKKERKIRNSTSSGIIHV